MDFEKFYKIFSITAAIIALIVGLYVYQFLPDQVPVHWNAAGEVDRYGSPEEGAFLMPVMMLLIVGLFFVIPRIAVFRKNFETFKKQYWILCAALQLFLLAVFAATLMPIAGIPLNMNTFIFFMVGALFVLIGILMPSFKRNFFVGVRTPWTIANDEVWDKTHKVTGKLFIVCGIIIFIASFIPAPYSVWAILVSAFGVTGISIGYSYWYYKKIGKPEL